MARRHSIAVSNFSYPYRNNAIQLSIMRDRFPIIFVGIEVIKHT
nr:MAG TPA: hypothetical protein [Caudoviricetes sp.]